VTRSKKVFVGFAVVFLSLLIYASIDIGSKTTFPGSKPQLRERIKESYMAEDSLETDTLAPSDP
jgi:hypothetical protein